MTFISRVYTVSVVEHEPLWPNELRQSCSLARQDENGESGEDCAADPLSLWFCASN